MKTNQDLPYCQDQKEFFDWTEEVATEEQLDQVVRAVNIHQELLSIAKAYRNLLRTMAHSDGEVATFHYIENVIARAEGK